MKQTILIREDLDLSCGKSAAQSAHTAVKARKNADDETLKKWDEELKIRIVLSVKDEDQLIKLKEKAISKEIPVGLIQDAGLTEVEPGTPTACAIGPAEENLVDDITGDLPLYK